MIKYYNVGPHRLAVRQWNGEGDLPPIVLVHGLVVSSRYFQRLGAELARQGHPVFAPDLPGHGYSTKPRPYLDTAGLGESLADFIAVAELRGVTLVGHSYGCSIVAEGSTRLDDTAVDRLVFLDPVSCSPHRGFTQLVIQFLSTVWREPPWTWAMAVLDLAQCGLRRSLKEAAELCSYPLEERLASLTKPTHFARGEGDSVAPEHWMEALNRETGGLGLITIADTSHEPHASSPREVARLLSRLSTEGRPQ